jgi:hypothetical protein
MPHSPPSVGMWMWIESLRWTTKGSASEAAAKSRPRMATMPPRGRCPGSRESRALLRWNHRQAAIPAALNRPLRRRSGQECRRVLHQATRSYRACRFPQRLPHLSPPHPQRYRQGPLHPDHYLPRHVPMGRLMFRRHPRTSRSPTRVRPRRRCSLQPWRSDDG